MGSAKKIYNGVIWSVLFNMFNALFGFVATPLLINYFGRSEYGLIAIATSANAYISLMDLGLSSTNVRFFANWLAKGDTDKVKKLMQTCTAFYGVVGMVNVLVLIGVYSISDRIFNVNDYQNILLRQLLVILMITSLINWYTSCFGQIISATENVAWVQKRNILTKLLAIIAIVLTLIFKFTIIQYYIATVCASMAVLPITIKKIKKECPYISLYPKFNKQIFKEILPYSLAIFSFGIFQTFFHNSRALILGIRGCVEFVTDYGVMNSLAFIVSTVSSVFIGALLPSSSRVVANGDKESYYRVAYQGTKFVSLILCFCVFGMMTLDKDLIQVYVGEEYTRLSIWLDLWLFAILGSHNSAISSLILAGSKLKELCYTNAFSAVLGVMICWWLVPLFESGGVIIGYFVYCLSQLSFFYLYYWPSKMKINSRRVFCQSFLPFVLLGGGIKLLLLFIPSTSNSWGNIFLLGGMFSVVYMLGAWFILAKEDKALINRVVR